VELSWSTFVLEIVNFLALVWILKRFLYKPVLEVIARRRAGIEKTVADAEALHAEAESLQTQYAGRLAEWNEERQRARDVLTRELDVERTRKMAEQQTALEQEQEMARVSELRRQADASHRIEEMALVQGARFATRLLEQAASADTETRLVELVINELSQLSAERVTALRTRYGRAPEAIVVVSAFPLATDQARRLERALAKITEVTVPTRFEQDSGLIAGLRITVGAWVLGANLCDELKGFAELAHGE
jgi:F-type H+-transporting ATPase subunit b